MAPTGPASPSGPGLARILRMGGMRGDAAFSEEFDGPGLDTSVRLPHYLPAWSSRAATAATYEVAGSVPAAVDPARPGALDARAIRTRRCACRASSTAGQLLRAGRRRPSASSPCPGGSGGARGKAAPASRGSSPRFGELCRLCGRACRCSVRGRWRRCGWSASRTPERCAEICVVEMFGDAPGSKPGRPRRMGLHPFRDPAPTTSPPPPWPIDLAEPHDMPSVWDADRGRLPR